MKYNIYENFSSDTSGNNTDTSKNDTSEDNTQVVTFVSQIFNNSGLFLLASFLVIYLVVFLLFGMYLRRSDRGSVDSSINHVNGAMNEYKFYITDSSLDGKLLKFELTPK